MVGGGDGTIKLWSADLKDAQTLSASDDGVLTMTHIDSLLYAGCISGTINLWDLDTFQLIRRVGAHQTDVLSLSGIGGFAFSGSAKGFLKKWDLSYVSRDFYFNVSRGFECKNKWQAHSGIVLSSVIGGNRLITGGNDCYVAVWDINACVPSEQKEETGFYSQHCD
jgi:di- and tripeptidase